MRYLLLCVALLASFAQAQVGSNEFHDIVYTQVGGVPRLLDLYKPPIQTFQLQPAIVFVHGGGWAGGDKSDFADWGRYYANLGYVCISINYRLIPQYSWPAQIDDTQAAVRWLRRQAPALSVDPNRIGTVGASAGGHLVLFLGETDTLNDIDPLLHGYSSRVQAVVDYYGPTDFSNGAEWDPSIWSLIQYLVGVTGQKRTFQTASPIQYVTPDDAPTLIFHGDADPIVPVAQSRRIVARMKTAGVQVSYYEFPGEGHGFGGAAGTQSINLLTAFFQAKLGP